MLCASSTNAGATVSKLSIVSRYDATTPLAATNLGMSQRPKTGDVPRREVRAVGSQPHAVDLHRARRTVRAYERLEVDDRHLVACRRRVVSQQTVVVARSGRPASAALPDAGRVAARGGTSAARRTARRRRQPPTCRRSTRAAPRRARGAPFSTSRRRGRAGRRAPNCLDHTTTSGCCWRPSLERRRHVLVAHCGPRVRLALLVDHDARRDPATRERGSTRPAPACPAATVFQPPPSVPRPSRRRRRPSSVAGGATASRSRRRLVDRPVVVGRARRRSRSSSDDVDGGGGER